MISLKRLVFALFLIAIVGMGCQKNYYTSSKAKNKDCGCPANK